MKAMHRKLRSLLPPVLLKLLPSNIHIASWSVLNHSLIHTKLGKKNKCVSERERKRVKEGERAKYG